MNVNSNCRRIKALASVPATALAVSVLLIVSSCDGGGITPPEAPLPSGTYVYGEGFTGSQGAGTVCSGGGRLELAVSGRSFTGTIASTGTCLTSDGEIEYTHQGSIVEGSRDGFIINFRSPDCRFEGQVSQVAGAPSLGGGMVCTSGVGSIPASVSGGWQADP